VIVVIEHRLDNRAKSVTTFFSNHLNNLATLKAAEQSAMPLLGYSQLLESGSWHRELLADVTGHGSSHPTVQADLRGRPSTTPLVSHVLRPRQRLAFGYPLHLKEIQSNLTSHTPQLCFVVATAEYMAFARPWKRAQNDTALREGPEIVLIISLPKLYPFEGRRQLSVLAGPKRTLRCRRNTTTNSLPTDHLQKKGCHTLAVEIPLFLVWV